MKPDAADATPTFGSRTDRPDGSSALTIGRRLPVPWETRIGTDVSLAAPNSNVPSENIRRGVTPDASTGAVWGSLVMPGIPPLGFDKAALNARVDAGKDEGKLGATLSRSMPIGRHLSVMLQHDYAVTQSHPGASAPATNIPLMTNPPPAVAGPENAPSAPAWSAGETVKFNVAPSGTTFSAGAATSTADNQWHHKLSIEQTLFGPLKLTTSIEDAGSSDSKQSITAGFKRVW